MKKILFLITAIFLSAPVVAKVCRQDWLAAWKTAVGTLKNSGRKNTNTYGSSSEAGIWAVYSDTGSPGKKHTVSGISRCANHGTTTNITDADTVPSVSHILADNKQCWCAMTGPDAGASWVFHSTMTATSLCADYCAGNCADCVRYGSGGSCSRAAVLALP